MSRFQRDTVDYEIRVTFAGPLGRWGVGELKYKYLVIPKVNVDFYGGESQEVWLKAEVKRQADNFSQKCGVRWTTATNERLVKRSKYLHRQEKVEGGVRRFRLINRSLKLARSQ